MKIQLKSFKNAFSGFFSALKEEGHLRFHFVAAVYVIIFSFWFNLSALKWAVILLLISGIIAAELFNTAIENLSDRITEEYDEKIKIAKDTGAAAVLILSVSAVIIAFIFFFDLEKIYALAFYLLRNPLLLILFIISLIISIVFILAGPKGIKRFFTKNKKSA